MSASITPTANPRSASAAARFTATDDLPTPPLPLAIISTLAVGGIDVWGVFWETFHRAFVMAAAFSSAVNSPHAIFTPVTPGIDSSRALTSRCICALSGQPEVVRAISTRISPSGETCTPRAMPSSTRLLPSSGSTTPLSSPITVSGGGGGSAAGSQRRSSSRLHPVIVSRDGADAAAGSSGSAASPVATGSGALDGCAADCVPTCAPVTASADETDVMPPFYIVVSANERAAI